MLELAYSDLPLIPKRLLLGLSGGLDSTVLLHVLANSTWLKQYEIELMLVHVNHHLHPFEDEAQAFVLKLAHNYGVAIQCLELRDRCPPGASLEAFMRKERYRLFNTLLTDTDVLVLAHHQDDQAETFLLRLLRGAGLPGLSGMPKLRCEGKGLLWRPLLSYSKEELRAYAKAHALVWCEDPDNQNLAFDRVYLRQELMPHLKAHWSKVSKVIARAAANIRSSAEVLDGYLNLELNTLVDKEARLDLVKLYNYPKPQALLLLKTYLELRDYPLSEAQLLRIYQDFVLSPRTAAPLFQYQGRELRRYQGQLYFMPELEAVPMNYHALWDGKAPLFVPAWPVALTPRYLQEQGLDIATLDWSKINVRLRQGSERCRPRGRSHSQTLNKCLQEYQIPPWLRPRLPLIYQGETLIMVVGAFVCDPLA